jgi:hypothetical protein
MEKTINYADLLLKNSLDKASKKNFLTRDEFKSFIEVYGKNLYYVYDFFGIMDNFKITKKGFTGKDIKEKVVQFNKRANKDFQFFKEAIKLHQKKEEE